MAEQWEAWVRPETSGPGVRLMGLRQLTEDGTVTRYQPADAPDYVREYLWIRDGMIAPDDVRTIEDLGALVGPGDLEEEPQMPSSRDHTLRFEVTAPVIVTPPPDVVQFDVDEATYVGDEQDGCYYQTGEGPDGWYATVVVDSDTGGFVDNLVTNSGPYDTEEHAAQVGRDHATTWCIDNGVSYEADRCSECGEELPPENTDGFCLACADADLVTDGFSHD